MPTTLPIIYPEIGASTTPQEIKDIRNSTWDYHHTYGMPVIHKHRWNMRDVRRGLAQKCPYHNMPGYEQGYSHCPYCFGTGILGGWANGQIAYVTFSDATEDKIKVGPQGVLLFDREPQLVAPWMPELGNGDLIITVDWDPDTFEVIEERERFTLKEVNPVTIRGFQRQVQTVEYRVNQQSMMDRVPDFDPLHEVPYIFDYVDLPPVPGAPDATGTVTDVITSFRIVGIDSAGHSSTILGFRIFGGGTNQSTTRSFRITGDPLDQGDVDVFFPPET